MKTTLEILIGVSLGTVPKEKLKETILGTKIEPEENKPQ